jgi:hypothetical protein
MANELMPQNAGDGFVPTKLVVRNDPEESSIGVADDSGTFIGILASPAAVSLLKDVLPSSGELLVALWRSYQIDRGAGPLFFSDLLELLTVIQAHPELSTLRKLTGFRDGQQVYHDVLVGTVMSLVAERRLSPRLVPSASPTRTPDIEVFNPERHAVEVKTLTRACVIDVVDEGIGINVQSVRYLREGSLRACADGFQQAPRGTVVLGVWCDFAGTMAEASPRWTALRIEADLIDWTCTQLLITMRVATGKSWFKVPGDSYADVVGSLFSDLRNPRRASLQLTAGAVNVVRGSGWVNVGRSFCAGNTGDSYGQEELQTIRFPGAMVHRDAARALGASARAFVAAVRRNPFSEGGQSVARTDERLATIFQVAVGLSDLLPSLQAISQNEGDRPEGDIAAVKMALNHMAAAIRANSAHLLDAAFVSLMEVPYWSNRLIRLALAVETLSGF